MATSNHITKVAIAGVYDPIVHDFSYNQTNPTIKASGNSGSFMTEALLKTGKHTVTAITRIDSQNSFPDGVVTKTVDYNKFETVVEALRGQDALVIALSNQVPEETHIQLINAAGEAGVAWILPNEWAPDTANEALVQDVFVLQPKSEYLVSSCPFYGDRTDHRFVSAGSTRQAIADLGKSSYVAVCTGFWYDMSLAIPAAFGIDFTNRTVTLFDEGETRISVGRAVAALLSLPIKSEGENKKPSLANLKDKVVYINSFTVSQRDILESVLRVTGTEARDWTTTKEPTQERYSAGLKEIQEGKPTGFPKMLFSRVFYPDGSGDFENNKGTLNSLLGLPKEDIDEATKVAIASFVS